MPPNTRAEAADALVVVARPRRVGGRQPLPLQVERGAEGLQVRQGEHRVRQRRDEVVDLDPGTALGKGQPGRLEQGKGLVEDVDRWSGTA